MEIYFIMFIKSLLLNREMDAILEERIRRRNAEIQKWKANRGVCTVESSECLGMQANCIYYDKPECKPRDCALYKGRIPTSLTF